MLSPLTVAALCALALLVLASIRRIPEGQAYTLRRVDGQTRVVGSGTHLVVPLVERIAHKISLAGASVPVDGLQRADQRYRGVVYFQVLDPVRADGVIDDVDDLLRAKTRQLFAAAEMPDAADARRSWLKQALNADLRERGLLVARVDLNARA
ncbi:MAG TPA: hypothetical protein VGC30_10080 [Dokdonella sp.]